MHSIRGHLRKKALFWEAGYRQQFIAKSSIIFLIDAIGPIIIILVVFSYLPITDETIKVSKLVLAWVPGSVSELWAVVPSRFVFWPSWPWRSGTANRIRLQLWPPSRSHQERVRSARILDRKTTLRLYAVQILQTVQRIYGIGWSFHRQNQLDSQTGNRLFIGFSQRARVRRSPSTNRLIEYGQKNDLTEELHFYDFTALFLGTDTCPLLHAFISYQVFQ